jgi:hypothetical protein
MRSHVDPRELFASALHRRAQGRELFRLLACRSTCKPTAEAGVPVLSLHFVSTASPVNRRSFSKFTASAGWSALRCLMAALLLVLPAAGQKSSPDQFTPVIVSPLTGSTRLFPGTDGKYHVVYELVVTNTKPTPATLKKVEVLDARWQTRRSIVRRSSSVERGCS